MASRKSERATIWPSRLVIRGKGPEEPHEALANLRDDPEAFQAFKARWGDLGKEEKRGGHSAVLEFRDALRELWRRSRLQKTLEIGVLTDAHFSFHRGQGYVQVQPIDFLHGTVMLLLLRDLSRGRTAICANPQCVSPYFVKRRRTQKYCMAGPCTEHSQREHKREWWRKHHGVKKQRSKQ